MTVAIHIFFSYFGVVPRRMSVVNSNAIEAMAALVSPRYEKECMRYTTTVCIAETKRTDAVV